jgi:hypothetical protein
MQVNGKEADVSKAFPLTIGDLKKLKAAGCDILRWRAGTEPPSEDVLTMVQYIIQKANPEITESDIDACPLKVWGDWSTEVMQAMPGETANPPS